MLKNYHEFIPKSFALLKEYSLAVFKKDLFAGVTVGIIALPLVMAFAIASGVAPEKGLYTAIIAGFLVGLLGGCNVQIVGPTAAFVAVVFSTLQRHGYEGLVLATLLAAVLLIVMGCLRLGSLIRYIPHPLIVGFTTGIAVVVITTQVKNFFGLQIASLPGNFVGKWVAYFSSAHTFDIQTTVISLSTLLFIGIVRRFLPTLPWGIVCIGMVTFVCWAFGVETETIASKYGAIPRTLPSPSLSIDWTRIFDVIPDAITIALLAGLESLLSAVIADGIIGGKHKPNCELIAQGVANIGSILFGGIPATAAIARTATNIKMGAQTPVAGMIHSLTLLFVLLFIAPLAGQIPLAALAAVMVVVAWNISEIPHFMHVLKSTKSDAAILLSSFFLTFLVDLTVAVEVGMILAALLFMKRMGDLEHVITPQASHPEKGIEVYEVKGPLFFGVAGRLKEVRKKAQTQPKTFILRMTHVPVLDVSGLHALKEFHLQCKKEGIRLIVADLQPEPEKLLKKFGLSALLEPSGLRD